MAGSACFSDVVQQSLIKRGLLNDDPVDIARAFMAVHAAAPSHDRDTLLECLRHRLIRAAWIACSQPPRLHGVCQRLIPSDDIARDQPRHLRDARAQMLLLLAPAAIATSLDVAAQLSAAARSESRAGTLLRRAADAAEQHVFALGALEEQQRRCSASLGEAKRARTGLEKLVRLTRSPPHMPWP